MMGHDSVDIGSSEPLVSSQLLFSESLLAGDLPPLAIGLLDGQVVLHDKGSVASVFSIGRDASDRLLFDDR